MRKAFPWKTLSAPALSPAEDMHDQKVRQTQIFREKSGLSLCPTGDQLLFLFWMVKCVCKIHIIDEGTGAYKNTVLFGNGS